MKNGCLYSNILVESKENGSYTDHGVTAVQCSLVQFN